MTEQKIKTDSKTKNPASPEIQPICQKNCKVCSSPYLKEIHDLRKIGKQYPQIIKILKDKYNFEISDSSLSRHFTNYRKRQQIISAEIINQDLIEEATEQARHTKEIVSLIDKALADLKARADAGILIVDISDLEKLFKIRHQILAGDNSEEKDLVGIFQKAVDKYGVDINQGILFKAARSNSVEKS